MTRDPLAGVQTALEEAREYFGQRADPDLARDGWRDSDEMRLLTEVEVGLTLLREVRNQRKAA